MRSSSIILGVVALVLAAITSAQTTTTATTTAATTATAASATSAGSGSGTATTTIAATATPRAPTTATNNSDVPLPTGQGKGTVAPTKAQRKELRLLDCTLEAKNLTDCNLETYATRVVTFAIPGILYAIFTLLICPFYCGGKYCCNCCGGSQQSQGCCCPLKGSTGDQLPMIYSSWDVIRVKLWLLVCLVLVFVAFIWGYVGAAELTGGLTDFGDGITAIPGVLTTQIQLIDDSLVLKTFDSTSNGTKTERLFSTKGNATKTQAEKARDDLKKQIDDNLGDYQARVDQAKEALWFAFLIPLCLIGFGFLLGVCNFRRIAPMAIVWLLFFFSTLIWACHGLFSAAWFIFSDVCVEIDGIANTQSNVIAQVAGCKDSQFTDFRTSFRQLEITQAEDTCNTISGLCWVPTDDLPTNLGSGKVYQCPSNLTCTGMSFARLVDLMQTSFYIHPSITTSNIPGVQEYRCQTPDVTAGGPCTIARCADDCVSSTDVCVTNGTTVPCRSSIGQSSKEIYMGFLGAKQISNSIDTLGAKFSNCDSAMKIVLGAFNTPCKRMVNGLYLEMHASGFLAFSMLIGIFVFAWGAKRFISFSLTGQPLVEGDPVEKME